MNREFLVAYDIFYGDHGWRPVAHRWPLMCHHSSSTVPIFTPLYATRNSNGLSLNMIARVTFQDQIVDRQLRSKGTKQDL